MPSVRREFQRRDHLKSNIDLEKYPTHLILHWGTNDAIQSSHQKIVDDLLKPKLFVLDELSSCRLTTSLLVKRTDNAKASATLKVDNEQVSEFKIS